MANYKTGMSSFDIGKIHLKFRSYLNRAALPAVPKPFGHVLANTPPGGWHMYGNDRYGDCTVAGIAHGLLVWNWVTKKHIPLFSESSIINQYLGLTGGADTGLDPVAVASWWKSTGLVDSSGSIHKCRSYTAVTTPELAVEAAFLFGFSGCAVWLPSSAMDQFDNNQVWDDTSDDPNPNEGHYIPLVGQNSAGNYMFVTWGRIQAATPDWVDKYFVGGVAYTSEDYMLKSGLSPDGFNFTQLDDDMAELSS